jgi:hypothetical protein
VASKRFPLSDGRLARFRFVQTHAQNGTGGAEPRKIKDMVGPKPVPPEYKG